MKKKKIHWPSYARKLRKSAEASIADGKYPDKEIERALSVPEPYYRAYALSEISLRLHDRGMEYTEIWEKAVRSAEDVEPEWKKEEILERLASVGYRTSMEIFSFPMMLEDRELRMKLVSKIARLGKKDDAFLERLWEECANLDEGQRYEVLRILIHSGLSEDMASALSETFGGEKRKNLIQYFEKERTGKGKKKMRSAEDVPPIEGEKPLFTMALYNSYKGKADENHYRNVARAAALCYAFGLNLALIGFPFKDAEECVEKTIRSTRIGKGGMYLKALHTAGRLSLRAGIGEFSVPIVATTSHPDPEKQVKIEEIKGKVVFILGTGHQGLPASVLKRADFHLEFTGKGASLETCTAMGVLACMLGK